MFAFIGVTRLDVIVAEGLAISEAHKESGKQAAFEAISVLDPCCDFQPTPCGRLCDAAATISTDE